MPNDTDQMTVYARAFVPVLIQIVTKLLVAAGSVLAAHGFITEDQIASGVPALAQEVVGLLIVFASAAFAAYRAKRNNDKLLAVKNSDNTFVPDSVLSIKGTPKNE